MNIPVIDLEMESDIPVIDLETESEDLYEQFPIEIEILLEKTAEVRKENGNQLYKVKQYRKALPFYSDAIDLCPETASYYGNRSACYMMLLQYKEALADARKSVEIDSTFLKGHMRVAKCCLMLGNLAAAESSLQEAQKLEPENDQLAHELATLINVLRLNDEAVKCFEQKDFQKVVYLMDSVLKVVVGCCLFKIVKAECLALLGKYNEAQDIASEVLCSDPKNADALYVSGVCMYYQNNVEKAMEQFQSVLRIVPYHPKALQCYKRAFSLMSTKEKGNNAFKAMNLNKAYELYSQALLIDPKNSSTNAKLYFNRATVSSKLNDFTQAVADCSAALKLNEKYIKAILHRAKCYQDLGLLEEAVKDYTKLCKLVNSTEHKKLLRDAKLALTQSKRKDYYKILGIKRNACVDEIKKAYRKRALVHHPDRHSSASEALKSIQERLFKEVGEAYATLSDPSQRASYDKSQNRTFIRQPSNPYHFPRYAADPSFSWQFFFFSEQAFV